MMDAEKSKPWNEKAGHTAELMVHYQSECKDPRVRSASESQLRSNPKAGEDQVPAAGDRQAERDFSLIRSFFSYSNLQWIRWGPSTLERETNFTQPTHSNVYLIQKYAHRHTQNNV